jgi:hypothetical protein
VVVIEPAAWHELRVLAPAAALMTRVRDVIDRRDRARPRGGFRLATTGGRT